MAWNGSSKVLADEEKVCSSPHRVSNSKQRCIHKICAIALILLPIALISAYFVSRQSQPKSAKHTTIGRKSVGKELINEKKVKIVPRSENLTAPSNDTVYVPLDETDRRCNPDGSRTRLSIITNNTGMILSVYKRADGSLVEVLDHVRPKHPDNAADQVLRMALASTRGGPPVPVRPGDHTYDEIFTKALTSVPSTTADDSSDTQALNEKLEQARQEMKSLMSETGRSFSDIILAHQENARENTKLLDECQKAINECLKADDKDGAATIYQRFSPQFEEMGISGLTLDPELDDE